MGQAVDGPRNGEKLRCLFLEPRPLRPPAGHDRDEDVERRETRAQEPRRASLIFELTTKIYDTNNATAIETDVTDYAVTANGVISFVSSSAQTGGDSLTVTAH